MAAWALHASLTEESVWSDNETEIDAINVQHVVGAVVDILNTPHLTPVTIGIFGPWGIGKSSVAQMVRQALTPAQEKEKKSGTLLVYFNGWRFEGYEDAKTALMSAILEEITKHRKLTVKAKKLLRRLWRSVNVMQLVKGGAEAAAHVKLAAITGGLTAPISMLMGLGRLTQSKVADATVGDTTKLLETAIGGADAAGSGAKQKRGGDDVARLAHRSVRDFEKHFATLLAETEITKLVVIDELDRCLPPHVIDTLEAIRLFLAVKGTAFVVAADETLVQHAVKDRFPGMEALRAQVGQDYLEKMIQVPARLPLLGRADLENYLNLLFDQQCLKPERFSALCAHLLKAPSGVGTAEPNGPGRDMPFSLDTAKALLAGDYAKELRKDLESTTSRPPLAVSSTVQRSATTAAVHNMPLWPKVARSIDTRTARRLLPKRGIAQAPAEVGYTSLCARHFKLKGSVARGSYPTPPALVW